MDGLGGVGVGVGTPAIERRHDAEQRRFAANPRFGFLGVEVFAVADQRPEGNQGRGQKRASGRTGRSKRHSAVSLGREWNFAGAVDAQAPAERVLGSQNVHSAA